MNGTSIAAYNSSVNITTLESEGALDIVNDYIVTAEWRALEVDSTSNIFKQSTHDGDHVFQCKAGQEKSPKKAKDLLRNKF